MVKSFGGWQMERIRTAKDLVVRCAKDLGQSVDQEEQW